jgi:hypothetical protein
MRVCSKIYTAAVLAALLSADCSSHAELLCYKLLATVTCSPASMGSLSRAPVGVPGLPPVPMVMCTMPHAFEALYYGSCRWGTCAHRHVCGRRKRGPRRTASSREAVARRSTSLSQRAYNDATTRSNNKQQRLSQAHDFSHFCLQYLLLMRTADCCCFGSYLEHERLIGQAHAPRRNCCHLELTG